MTRVTLGKSRVRESRTPGSVKAKAEWLSYSTTIRDEVNRAEYEDHVIGFKLGSISKITGTLQKLGAQVFHLGWKRSMEKDDKASASRRGL